MESYDVGHSNPASEQFSKAASFLKNNPYVNELEVCLPPHHTEKLHLSLSPVYSQLYIRMCQTLESIYSHLQESADSIRNIQSALATNQELHSTTFTTQLQYHLLFEEQSSLQNTVKYISRSLETLVEDLHPEQTLPLLQQQVTSYVRELGADGESGDDDEEEGDGERDSQYAHVDALPIDVSLNNLNVPGEVRIVHKRGQVGVFMRPLSESTSFNFPMTIQLVHPYHNHDHFDHSPHTLKCQSISQEVDVNGAHVDEDRGDWLTMKRWIQFLSLPHASSVFRMRLFLGNAYQRYTALAPSRHESADTDDVDSEGFGSVAEYQEQDQEYVNRTKLGMVIQALDSNNLERFHYLAEVGQVDLVNDHGVTALMHYCSRLDMARVTLLIENGARVDVTGHDDRYPFEFAIAASDQVHLNWPLARILALLMPNAKSIVPVPLHSLSSEHTRIIAYHLAVYFSAMRDRAGYDLVMDALPKGTSVKYNHYTLEYAASLTGKRLAHVMDVVVRRYSLDGSTEDLGQDKSVGKTPLMMACEANNVELVEKLVELRACVDCVNTRDEDKTALIYATIARHDHIVKVLLKHNANTNLQMSSNKLKALDLAIWHETTPCVRLLFRPTAEQPDNNTTFLMYAVRKRKLHMVELLIDLGADVNAKNRVVSGKTALWYAVQKGFFDIAKVLVKGGADKHVVLTNNKTLYQEFPDLMKQLDRS